MPGPIEAGIDVHAGCACRQTAAHVGVTGECLGRRIQLQPGARIHVVEQQIGIAPRREAKTKQRRVVGRRDLGMDAVVQPNGVAIGAGLFVVMRKPQCTLAAIGVRHAGSERGHHLKRLPVAHPRARLMAERQRLQTRTIVCTVVFVPAI